MLSSSWSGSSSASLDPARRRSRWHVPVTRPTVAAAASARRKAKATTGYSHSLTKLASPGGHAKTVISTERLNGTVRVDAARPPRHERPRQFASGKGSVVHEYVVTSSRHHIITKKACEDFEKWLRAGPYKC